MFRKKIKPVTVIILNAKPWYPTFSPPRKNRSWGTPPSAQGGPPKGFALWTLDIGELTVVIENNLFYHHRSLRTIMF
jgi:hypothetical protein